MDARDLWQRVVARAQRGARGDAIPTPDLSAFRRVGRRTRVVRLALAVALVGGTLLALALVPPADDRRFLPAANVGIVVLDVSTSVKPSTYDLIREQLVGLSSTSRRFGVVLFSDVAYEALPPATPARELRKFVRFFRAGYRYDEDGNALSRSPWEDWFSAGTSISSGLLLAAQMLEQRPYTDRGVVLISDLADDPSDLQKLADTIALYSRRSIPLNVVALDPAPEDREFFLELLDNPAAISNVQLPTAQAGRGSLAITSRFPWATAAVAAFVVALLAASVYWTEPLQWRRTQA
jgi:hypothetical protein